MDLPDPDEMFYPYSERLDRTFQWNREHFQGSRRFKSNRNTKRLIREMDPEVLKRLESYINMNIKLDLQVQRLAAIVHKRRDLEESIKEFSKKELAKDEVKAEVALMQAQIEALEIESKPAGGIIFNISCSIFLSLAEFPNGELRERLERGLHADSNWISEHCKSRGGCCAYDCECCSWPRDGIAIKGVGHCTLACICCEGRRGTHIDTANGDPHGMVMRVDDLAHSRESLGLVDFFIGFITRDLANDLWN